MDQRRGRLSAPRPHTRSFTSEVANPVSLPAVIDPPKVSVWSCRMSAAWIDVVILALVFLALSLITGGAHAGQRSGSAGTSAVV